jgi:hypothetical protein
LQNNSIAQVILIISHFHTHSGLREVSSNLIII